MLTLVKQLRVAAFFTYFQADVDEYEYRNFGSKLMSLKTP